MLTEMLTSPSLKRGYCTCCRVAFPRHRGKLYADTRVLGELKLLNHLKLALMSTISRP